MATAINASKLIAIPAQTIDDYCDLLALRAAFAPTEARFRKAHEQMKMLLDNADPEAEYTVKGERHKLRISACGWEMTPDVPTVRKKLGAAVFLLVASVTKAALAPFMLKPDIDECCLQTQSGPRKFTPIPLSE